MYVFYISYNFVKPSCCMYSDSFGSSNLFKKLEMSTDLSLGERL
jgi:hypothetical protein